MKRALTIITVLSFISIAVFGFMAIGHGNEHKGRACLATTVNGQSCPKEFGLAGILAFHLGTFKSFSTAVFAQTIFMSLVFGVLALLWLQGIGSNSFSELDRRNFCYRHKYKKQSPVSVFKSENFRWLSLHENSPAFA